ncbi:MAG TPA: FAD-dependent oxidoreductase, partial [Stellaceae bacterium]|nr:FAD-dependent oxidoreductase [Stellaceae bacterium]
GAVQLGASVVLVERGLMGGDCLNYGCVPSKSLLAAARHAAMWRAAGVFGVSYEPPRIDFAAAMESVAQTIARLAPNDSAERFTGLGVRVLAGEGRFTGPDALAVGEAEIRPRRFVLATGSHPFVPSIPGLAAAPYLTNETVFGNRVLPDHLLVIGGGPIGIELAQAHRRLGARVSVFDAGPLLPREDPELAQALAVRLATEGIALHPQVTIAAVERAENAIVLVLADGERIAGSHLLLAAGRQASLEALELARAGIEALPSGITVDRRLRTTNRRAFAIGDAAGGPQFTHAALYHAGIVIRNALFRIPAKVDYRALPWVTYTDPELAQVGLTEKAARARHPDILVERWPFAENDRAQCERASDGMVKLVLRRGGQILGAAILGQNAGDLILPWTLAIARGLKIGAMANLVVPYPTRGEAGKRAAGAFYAPRLFSARSRALVRFLARFG